MGRGRIAPLMVGVNGCVPSILDVLGTPDNIPIITIMKTRIQDINAKIEEIMDFLEDYKECPSMYLAIGKNDDLDISAEIKNDYRQYYMIDGLVQNGEVDYDSVADVVHKFMFLT